MMNEKVDLKGSIILNPVPVVMVTSRGKDGKDNVFTVGWVGTVCTKPPMLSISVRPERLSHKYISETMEFTVNMPTSKLTKAVDYVGVRSGKTVDNKNLFDEKGKIHLEKADLISYCHGEYFKMDTNPLGSFGYSVAKKKKALQSKSVKAKKDTPTAKSKSSKSKKSFNKKGR